MKKFYSRKPYYKDDSDYTTNAPSYYDDLARKNKLIKELARRIWDYDKTLEENLQMLKDKLEEIENIIGVGFDLRIEELLREWVNDGTLDDIINEEIFNTKADIEWVNEEIGNAIDWVNNELNKTTYYDRYTITKNNDPVSETDYWITEIITDHDTPLFFDVTDGREGETVREYAIKHDTTLSINGSTMQVDDVGNIYPSGVTIINREVITDEPSSFQWKVGLTSDNKLVYFSPEKTSHEILNEEPDIEHVLTAFTPLIINGETADQEILSDGINYEEKHPRQVIGQKRNGNIIFFTTGGRGYGGSGMLASDCIRILQNIGCELAFMLDGGGSTSLVEKGIFINNRIDGLGTRERKRPTTINLGTTGNRPYMYDIRDLFSRVSDIEARLYTFESPQLVSNINIITRGGFYWALRTGEGVPNDDNSWAIIHFQMGSDRYQIAFPFRASYSMYDIVYIRRSHGDGWSRWQSNNERKRIPDLTHDTEIKDLPVGVFGNNVLNWDIKGSLFNGYVETFNTVDGQYAYCRQIFYPSASVNIYTRASLGNSGEWGNWFLLDRTLVE